MPLSGNSGYLELGGRRSNVRIEPRPRRGHQVDRHIGARMLRLVRCNVARDAIDQFLIRWSGVRAAGVRRIISIARSRWSRVKVLWSDKRLSNNPRADKLPVLVEKLPV